jgi:hypothetical protein
VELSVSSAATELTLCDEFHFNNNGRFTIRSVIFTVVFLLGMNRIQGEDRGEKKTEGCKAIHNQSREMVVSF